jgi:amino acid transporter
MVFLLGASILASFDSSVHISEEASNAATAVPWAIVNAVAVAGVLGFGMSAYFKDSFPGPTLSLQRSIWYSPSLWVMIWNRS